MNLKQIQRHTELSESVLQEHKEEGYALKMREMKKQYRDFCLGPLNLAIPSGCITGIAGENGAGKTTLMKAALGMVQADQGEVYCLDMDVKQCGKEIRRRTGAVLSSGFLPGSFTARTAASLWEKLYDTFDEAYFYEIIEKLHIPANKKIQAYSAGTKMKLALAGALSHQASLLLLDEPLNGLDPVSREEVLNLIRDFVSEEDRTVLISSHVLSDLEKISDYLIMLSGGKTVLFEEKDALLERYVTVKGSWEAILRLENEGVRLLGTRRGSFGTWALLDKSTVAGRMDWTGAGLSAEPASLEEIAVCLMKEAEGK